MRWFANDQQAPASSYNAYPGPYSQSLAMQDASASSANYEAESPFIQEPLTLHESRWRAAVLPSESSERQTVLSSYTNDIGQPSSSSYDSATRLDLSPAFDNSRRSVPPPSPFDAPRHPSDLSTSVDSLPPSAYYPNGSPSFQNRLVTETDSNRFKYGAVAPQSFPVEVDQPERYVFQEQLYDHPRAEQWSTDVEQPSINPSLYPSATSYRYLPHLAVVQ